MKCLHTVGDKAVGVVDLGSVSFRSPVTFWRQPFLLQDYTCFCDAQLNYRTDYWEQVFFRYPSVLSAWPIMVGCKEKEAWMFAGWDRLTPFLQRVSFYTSNLFGSFHHLASQDSGKQVRLLDCEWETLHLSNWLANWLLRSMVTGPLP